MTYNGTGLNTTLDQLITQLVNQHTATSNKLDAILSALGAPPPTQTVTLQNVVDAITALNTNITTFRGEQDAQQTVLLGAVASLNQQFTSFRQEQIAWRNFQQGQLGNMLAAISSLIDEATRTTNAVYATACPCNGQTVLPPELGTTPLPSEQQQEHCRRVQWMLDEYFNVWIPRIRDGVRVVNGVGTAVVLTALLATGIGAIPSALISGSAVAVNAAWNAGVDGMVNQATAPRRVLLRQALYAADSPAAAATAWANTIDSMSEVPQAYRDVWKSLIWSSWFNDLFDQTKTPANSGGAWNTAGYDGSVCAPPTGNCQSPGDGWICWQQGEVTLSAGQQHNIIIPTSLNYKDIGIYGFNDNSDGDIAISIVAFSITESYVNRFLPGLDPVRQFLSVTPVEGAALRFRNLHPFSNGTIQYRIYYRV